MMTAGVTAIGSTRRPIMATEGLTGMSVATGAKHINGTAGTTRTGMITGVASVALTGVITIVIVVRIAGTTGATIVAITVEPGVDRLPSGADTGTTATAAMVTVIMAMRRAGT